MFQRVLMAALLAGAFATASAGTIVSAVSAVATSGGPGLGLLQNTYNQVGLLSNYVSGVTDFDTYLATNPRHAVEFADGEWFSNANTSSASVTYDLGAVLALQGLALWNEDASGIGRLDLYSSVNGVDFTAVSLGLTPPNNPFDQPYGADVFAFAERNVRFLRFDMSDCPQPGGGFFACAIGEVAFDRAQAPVDVPEPGSLLLMGAGLAALGLLRKRRRLQAR